MRPAAEGELGWGLLAVLLVLCYLGAAALAYAPSFRSDALRTAVTVVDVSPAGGPAPFRFFPALRGPESNVTDLAATVAASPRLALHGPAWQGYERGRTYVLWVVPESFRSDEFGRAWIEPFDLQDPGSPLTLKQQRALLAPTNLPGLLGLPYLAALGGLAGLWWWRRWSVRALVLLVAAWAVLGGGVYAGEWI